MLRPASLSAMQEEDKTRLASSRPHHNHLQTSAAASVAPIDRRLHTLLPHYASSTHAEPTTGRRRPYTAQPPALTHEKTTQRAHGGKAAPSSATSSLQRQKSGSNAYMLLPPSTTPAMVAVRAGREASSTAVKTPARRPLYVVGTMPRCGSVFEEMTRQLLRTGQWTRVEVVQRSGVAGQTLYVPQLAADLSHVDVHLLLGEKTPAESVIATRRTMCRRLRSSRPGGGPFGRTYTLQGNQAKLPPPPMPRRGLIAGTSTAASLLRRMPMGDAEADGVPRVVDFVEHMRCITLKSSMVTTLLRHHKGSWESLGSYLPRTFHLLPRQSLRDDREALRASCTAQNALQVTSDGGQSGPPSLWIAKSSYGCHGDNIKIFSGDAAGFARLLRFIDGQRHPYPWVVQTYIDRPLLYHKRKFDIRCWVLLVLDHYEVYVYDELVMRMSSLPYSRDTAASTTSKDRLAHITNHCVQSAAKTYSLYEEGNELWKEHLDGLVRYKMRRAPSSAPPAAGGSKSATTTRGEANNAVPYATPLRPDASMPGETNGAVTRAHLSSIGSSLMAAPTLRNTILPQIHHVVLDSMLAARAFVPPEPPALPPATHCFQLFGYDFLIDEDMRVWLLEINGAPAAAERLLPKLVADLIELAVTPYFPLSPVSQPPQLAPKARNGFVLIHSTRPGASVTT